MKTQDIAEQVIHYIDQVGGSDEPIWCDLPGLVVVKHDEPTTFEASLYQPVVCLILQGRKETMIGDRVMSFGAGESLIASHDLPVVSRITEASPDRPYLAMILMLDLGIVRSLYDQVGASDTQSGEGRSLDVHKTEPALLDALGRYVALLGRTAEAEVMAPLILKEIHFRLLMAPHGAMLRNLLWRDSHASRIARAIARIRQEFRSSLAVADLADAAGMSASSFHEHFKSITATTPLQYQKDLRLMEARRLLSEGNHTVSAAAFEVGYESPTQFSREYARKFGASPRSDVGKALVSV
jgi:AraC-like DNA-binding protein